jgi:20S proteasome subunit alpha 3
LACAVAGITADANILVNYARLTAQQHLKQFQEPMPCEILVQRVCNKKQGYTQYGGLRPFGVSFLFAGWDQHYGYQLYESDPSGNYGGWKAAAIGENHDAAKGILKTDYKEGMDVKAALELAIKVISKTMDSTTLSPEKVEVMVFSRAAETGKCSLTMLPKSQLAELVKTVPPSKD